jgi:hypothetical protein
MALGESPMVHEVGLLASQYRRGGPYYQPSTALSEDQVAVALRSFLLGCVWGESADEMRGRILATATDRTDWESIEVWGAKIFPDAAATLGLDWLFGNAIRLHLSQRNRCRCLDGEKIPVSVTCPSRNVAPSGRPMCSGISTS